MTYEFRKKFYQYDLDSFSGEKFFVKDTAQYRIKTAEHEVGPVEQLEYFFREQGEHFIGYNTAMANEFFKLKTFGDPTEALSYMNLTPETVLLEILAENPTYALSDDKRGVVMTMIFNSHQDWESRYVPLWNHGLKPPLRAGCWYDRSFRG